MLPEIEEREKQAEIEKARSEAERAYAEQTVEQAPEEESPPAPKGELKEKRLLGRMFWRK